jgi:hypothetical protein
MQIDHVSAVKLQYTLSVHETPQSNVKADAFPYYDKFHTLVLLHNTLWSTSHHKHPPCNI